MKLFICFVYEIVFFAKQGAGHNDVEMYTQYLERLKQFVSVELVNWQQLNSDVSAQDAGSGGCFDHFKFYLIRSIFVFESFISFRLSNGIDFILLFL